MNGDWLRGAIGMDSSIDMFEKRALFWMTKAIAQGGFPLDEDFADLRAAGVTHLVNLVACGKDPDEVVRRMVAGSPFAIPGNPALVDEELLEKAREHGRTYDQPHPRPEVLEWV